MEEQFAAHQQPPIATWYLHSNTNSICGGETANER